jgi:sec-independent protein translocase protein TatA
MQLLAGIGPLGLPELGLILVIVLLIFGAGRLPDVGGAIGKSVREFRKAAKDDDADAKASVTTNSTNNSASAPATTPETIFCAECGTKNPRNAKFCAQCGHSIVTPVS